MGRLLSDKLILQHGTNKNFDLHGNLGGENKKFTWKDSEILVKLRTKLVSDRDNGGYTHPKTGIIAYCRIKNP